MRDPIKIVSIADVTEVLAKVLEEVQVDSMPLVKAQTLINGSRAYVIAVIASKRYGKTIDE